MNRTLSKGLHITAEDHVTMIYPVLLCIATTIRIAYGCLGLLILLLSHAAFAGCNNYGWIGNAVQLTAVPSTIIVPASQNNTLYTPLSDWYNVSSTQIVYCPGGGNLIGVYTTLQQSPATGATAGSYSESGFNYTIYNTSVPGIGYIINTSVVAGGVGYGGFALNGNTAKTLAAGTVYSNITINLTVRVRFIKTADLTANSYTLNKATLVNYNISTSYASGSGSVYMGGSSLSLPDNTCTVNTQSITLPLPNISPSKLPTVNATTGDTPFNIILYCPASRNLYMTLTDNTNPGRTSSIIGLAANGSTASGIGIQITRNGNPILLGPDSSTAGNTNQFLIGNKQLGTVTIPLSAQYIRTGTVQSGTVRAVATFTMSYQ